MKCRCDKVKKVREVRENNYGLETLISEISMINGRKLRMHCKFNEKQSTHLVNKEIDNNKYKLLALLE